MVEKKNVKDGSCSISKPAMVSIMSVISATYRNLRMKVSIPFMDHMFLNMSDIKRPWGVIRSIHRILRPDGKFFVSVPDLDTLCRLFVDEQLTPDERFYVMRMMFGGQTDEHDFHYVGLNAEFLAHFLNEAGFREIYRPPEFNIFHDTSSMKYRGVLISLNMVAIK